MESILKPNDKEYCKSQLRLLREQYNLIGKVYCPCLKTDIVFNAQGFYHFKYHGGGEARVTKDTIHRLKLFPLVIPVIKNSKNIIEYEKINEVNQKQIEYFGLIAKVGKNRNVKIKVVLKKVGAGNVLFWSVIKLKK